MRSRPSMRLVFAAAIATLVCDCAAAALEVAQVCTTATPGQLTWSCGGVCDDYSPCLVFNASDCASSTSEHSGTCTMDADEVCAYACFSDMYLSTAPSQAVLLVPFSSTYQSSEEVAARASMGDAAYDALINAQTNSTSKRDWVDDDLLDSIGVMDLKPTDTSMYLCGGSSYNLDETVRGKVVNVALDSGLLASKPNVTKISVSSVNLKSVTNFATFFPTTVEILVLKNNLIYDFPYDETHFPALFQLFLSKNYLTSYEGAYPTMKYLYLDNNSISSFDTYFPIIEKLDLRKNSLTTIPDIIFNMTTLQYVGLSGNSFKGMPTFTASQLAFFKNLTALYLTQEDFAQEANCGSMKSAVLNDFLVCISDEATGSETESEASDSKSESGSETKATSESKSGSGTETKTASSGSDIGVIVGIVAGAVVGALVIGFVWRVRRQRRHKNSTNTESSSNDAPLWNDEQLRNLRLDTEDIEDVKKLGSGSFGVVWLVRYRSTHLFASKRLIANGKNPHGSLVGKTNSENPTQQRGQLQRFVEEIKLVVQLDHKNIVRLKGVAWTFHSDIQALFDYMENGDLRDYIINTKPKSSQDDQITRLSDELFKLQMASDIVEALVYVHSFMPPIVHRDLKSRNVLLSADWKAMLTDFGAARVQSENHTMTAGVGTGRWLAPEVLSGSNNYGTPADIYAFGVMLSELDTHAVPYDDARGGAENKPLANVAILQFVAEGKLRPTFSSSCRPELRALADRCMAQSSYDRPAAAVVVYELHKLMKLVQQQIDHSQGTSAT